MRRDEGTHRKKTLTPTEQRDSVGFLIRDAGLSIRAACNVVGLSRSAFYREVEDPALRDEPVMDVLNEIIEENPGWGFWLSFKDIRHYRQLPWNHKRVHRIYCAMGLNMQRRSKRRIPTREPQPLDAVPFPDRMWSMDFMHDALYRSKRFRTLNIIDEGTRECLRIEVDTSLSAERVVRVLEQLKEERGLPEQIRVDNGPEFTSALLENWCEGNGVKLAFIQPGKPYQNAYIERFNRTYRREVLNTWIFESLDQVQDITWKWMIRYNERRSHEALGDMSPVAFRDKAIKENSTFKWSS